MTIYTDNAATTRMSDTAVAAMLPCLQDNYGRSPAGRPGDRGPVPGL